MSNSASETRFHVIKTILYVFYDIKEYICRDIFSNKLFVFPVFRSYLECFQKSGINPKILSCAEMHFFFEIRSKVKSHPISEAGVRFRNIVRSVYHDMGWRTHFLHMAANYRLKSKTAKHSVRQLVQFISYIQSSPLTLRGP